MKIHIAVTGFIIQFICVGNSLAQPEPAIANMERTPDIEEGERLTLELVQFRQKLPTRWAAIVKYQTQSTPDAETFELIKGVSYVAEDRKLKIKVQRRKETDLAFEGSFPSEWYTWNSASEHLIRSKGNWVLEKTQIERKHPFIDPFLLGLSSAYTLSSGLAPDFVETFFFGGGLYCVGSKEMPSGQKVVWAVETVEKRIPTLEKSRIVFSVVLENGLPIDFETRYYPKWELNNPKFPSRLANKTTTKWKRFEDLDLSVPIEILGNWSPYDRENESAEVRMTVSWLFGDDVPDDAFSDPRVKPPIIPKFPGPDK